MRRLLFVLTSCIMFFACTKNSNSLDLAGGLTGKWALEPGTSAVTDTLIFYSEGDSAFFFDKSVYYQFNTAAWTTDDAFRYNYKTGVSLPDSVTIHKMTSAPGLWVNVYLRQISATEIEIGNFRYVNLSDEKYIYRKVE